LFGVHRATRALLREIHHTYVGWPQALSDLHRSATGDLYHYAHHPRGAEGVAVFSELYAKVVSEADPPSVREHGLRLWIYYLDKVVREFPTLTDSAAVALDPALGRLRRALDVDPRRAVSASPWLRRLASSVSARGDVDERLARDVIELYCDALARVYHDWLEEEDPAEWFAELATVSGGPLPEAVRAASHAHLRASLDRVGEIRHSETTAGTWERLSNLPDNRQISESYLLAAEGLDSGSASDREELDARLTWLFRILEMDRLSSVHERALQAIGRCSARAIGDPEDPRAEAFLRGLFSRLGARPASGTASALELIRRVGSAVLARSHEGLIGVVIDELLERDFRYPAFEGFTSEWQPIVDPAHLQNVRAYLEIVKADPLAARPVLAALVVHMKVGGAFLADTDLFQRDVSALLAADITPAYDLAKQLLRMLPVYFSDIGAEGDLREFSTRLDEIDGRRDPLCHFLRKQSHVECNPRLIGFCEDVALFWATGDRDALASYVPASLLEDLDPLEPGHALRRALATALEPGEAVGRLFSLSPEELRDRLARDALDPVAAEKVELLSGVRREIARKYALDHDDVIDRLERFSRADPGAVRNLSERLASGDHRGALEAALGILEGLQDFVLGDLETAPSENIYRKRHIAVGIPSLYGSYREPRFEAMGLTFRLESLAGSLLDRVVQPDRVVPLDEEALRLALEWMELLVRAVRIDGYDVRSLTALLRMLREAIEHDAIGWPQYGDVLRLLCREIEAIVEARVVEPYREPVERISTRLLERGELPEIQGASHEEGVLRFSERFLRGLIADNLGLQRLDVFASRLLHAVREKAETAEDRSLAPGRARTPARERAGVDWVRRIDDGDESTGGVVLLGNKGTLLGKMRGFGLPVPDGFILTTDVFRARAAFDSEPLRTDLAAHVLDEVSRLERSTGYRLGDPRRPLLLSVRGGGPLSMPGMLDSFLNVGINEEIAEAVARLRGHPWAAWDAYRRFIQFWGMSYGLSRDVFDALIGDVKRAHGVPKKSMLSAEQMRALARRYRALLEDSGVPFVDDPTGQLFECIRLVLRSWDSRNASLYRDEMKISNAWGTGVTVQSMVFGNLSQHSGTGVLVARRRLGSEGIRMRGDFVVQGQGDDVVSGLVETYPITEEQRAARPGGVPVSLEASFPLVHTRLARIARSLVLEHELRDQEIEFTFESERPEDLSILQTRDAVLSRTSTIEAFEPGPVLDESAMGMGIGASGGALSGRVAHSASDIDWLASRFPGDRVILVRPDTVPEDIALVLRSDGLLTARGGATSHAAVVARHLGKVCVVGCPALVVHEREGYSELAGQRLERGELISMNGLDGSLYAGEHATITVRVRGRTH
jgi:pyruvate,orthophosphate dikinase